MSPCFACESDALLCALEQETQVVEGKKKGEKKKEENNVLMQKNKTSASVKRPHIFKIQMEGCFLNSVIQEKDFCIKPIIFR